MRMPILLLVAGAMFVAAPLRAQESAILSAMQDELQRSMASLRIDGQPAPYYIAYQVDETAGRGITARLGEVAEDAARRTRVLRVEVRVGDYTFDSSRFLAPAVGTDSLAATLDDDYDVMRRQIWLLTDAAYKRAVNVFARKKAAFQNSNAAESIPDYSRATPVERVQPAVLSPTAWNEWSERARQISAVFLSDPDILSSEVNVIEERGRRYFVNSEGFRLVMPIGTNGLRVIAEAQAPDGAAVRDYFEIFERSLSEMPAPAELLARTRELAARMAAARQAKVGEDYSGPVLFEGRGAAELVAQVLVPALLATRPPDTDRGARGGSPPFLSRIGSRVMAEDLSVSDTPSLTQFGGRAVPGAYELDDEGIPASDVTLVESGKLMTLLTSRVPQRNLPQSNGHGRGGAAQAGVVQVKSANALPADKLRATYLDTLKKQGRPFGYIVRAMAPPTALITSAADIADLIAQLSGGGAGAANGPLALQIVKVTPDGAEEIVRGMRFGALTPNLFRDVVGASEERLLLTYRAGTSVPLAPGSLGARQVPVSVIVPSLIVDDVELQRMREVAQKPPVVPSPLKR